MENFRPIFIKVIKNNIFLGSNLDQPLSRMFHLLQKGFENTLGANKNWGRWSDMVAVMSPDIASHKSALQKILSMRVLEWLVSLVGSKIYEMIV